jgi:predicted ABC-type ATPase
MHDPLGGEKHPILHLIVGPNGAGKTTFYYQLLARSSQAQFINADEIERAARQAGETLDSYAAAQRAAAQRDTLIGEGRSFVAETVFSHPSKLDLLRQARMAGYTINLYHLHVRHADISVARVAQRVVEGGHAVPEAKTRERHARNQALIREATLLADVTRVYDCSRYARPPRWLMTLVRGRVVKLERSLPGWARALYRDQIRPYRLPGT